MTNQSEIVAEARRWIGVRWRHQGRSRTQGVDCIGLCLKVAEAAVDQVFTDERSYPRRADGVRLRQSLRGGLAELPPQQARPGDVLLFEEGGFACHVGICAARQGAPTVIHAHAARRKVMEERIDGFADPIAAFRFR